MRLPSQTEVLVVGAGPVGRLTALLLAQRGIDVTSLDAAPGRAMQSYACGLHPATLKLLRSAGLGDEVNRSGGCIQSLAFYEGHVRRAKITFPKLSSESPLVVLPQSSLEGILEQKLTEAHIKVLWNHRLSDLQADRDRVQAAEMTGTAMGYGVPRWKKIVQHTSACTAAFIVGADGNNSFVNCGASKSNFLSV